MWGEGGGAYFHSRRKACSLWKSAFSFLSYDFFFLWPECPKCRKLWRKVLWNPLLFRLSKTLWLQCIDHKGRTLAGGSPGDFNLLYPGQYQNRYRTNTSLSERKEFQTEINRLKFWTFCGQFIEINHVYKHDGSFFYYKEL